ncbi:MAG TPA: response regulator transcription factor [Chthoniobacteraceae bacterium]|jgi:DNA-binding NarL/FixJ family response regulator|nr:response regulator transcription factor [Chthoniobacteraceae bacterium]
MKVLLADDHIVVREGLKHIIESQHGEVTFGDARDGTEALNRIWNEDWDLVLLDIHMPGRDGIEVLREAKKAKPRTPVLIISGSSHEEYAVRALRDGAAGYIEKNAPESEFLQAVSEALAGRCYVTPAVAQKLAREVASPKDKPVHETLSDREYQVMKMLASGKTVKEVAAELSLSVKTVSTYRTRILEKLNLTSNVDIARFAIKAGLVG